MADDTDNNYLEPEDQIDDEPVDFDDEAVEDDYIGQSNQVFQKQST